MADDVLSLIRRVLAPIQRRVMLAIGRAVIQASRDGEGMQVLKVSLLDGELRDRVERMQEYGFTSRPLDGCEAAAVFVGGDRGHGLIVATDDRRHRKTGLSKGEVALYTDEGDYILLKRGRIMEVVAGAKLDVTAPEVTVDCDTATVTASTKVTADTPDVEMTGNLTVAGVITGQSGLAITGTLPGGEAGTFAGDLDMGAGDIQFDGLSSYRNHTHPGDSGGTTGTPQ